jgi:hypothetical protein
MREGWDGAPDLADGHAVAARAGPANVPSSKPRLRACPISLCFRTAAGSKAGQRRRRYYRLTSQGRTVLASQRSIWENFIFGLSNVAQLRQT